MQPQCHCFAMFQIDMVKARCPIPMNAMFKYGPQGIQLSVDAGREYNFLNMIYIREFMFISIMVICMLLLYYPLRTPVTIFCAFEKFVAIG